MSERTAEDQRSARATAPGWLKGSAETGEGTVIQAMAALDWTQTPLGAPDRWPVELSAVVQSSLESRFPIWIGWGPELTFLYNDAYARMTLVAKHPWALGRPAREVWAEIWSDIGPRIQEVLDGRGATWDERLLLFLQRSGYREETYHTFSYSPLRDAGGAIAGMICVVSEETERVIGERRLATLRALAAGIASARTEPEVLAAVSERLGENRFDFPFSLVYLYDGPEHARLAASAGIMPGEAAAPAVIGARSGQQPWPLPREHDQVVVRSLQQRFEHLPTGEWEDAPDSAVVASLGQAGDLSSAGMLIAGCNPYRPLDAEKRAFIGLVAGQIAAAIARARAYDQEQERARALLELDRVKTQFFSNVSHELRTPLTLIMAPAQDSLEDTAHPLAPEQRERVVMIERNAGRLMRMVNDILDFSRLEGGRLEAKLAPTDLAPFTAGIVASFAPAIERGGLELREDLGPLPGPVMLDPEMWEKVVLNLLSNALKFTITGQISVSLRDAEGRVQLEVADTGIGIAAEDIPHLFERFYRVSETSGRSHEGSGIGLALVHELVALHGGSVSVASEVGHGSRFTITVPYGDPVDSPDVLTRSPTSAAASYLDEALSWQERELRETLIDADAPAVDAQSGGERPSVLVVDDNADLRSLLARLLTPHYRVRTAPDGQRALELIGQAPPDLVLADVMMPQLDGFGLLRALRQDPETASLPVILLSARAGEEAAIGGLEAGADEYLIKPFSARELVARVRSSLELSAVRREAGDALAAERHRLEQTLEQLPAGVILCDARSLSVVLANQRACELTGRRVTDNTPLVQLIANGWATLDETPLVMDDWPLVQAVRHGVVTRERELIFHAENDRELIFSVSAAPIRDPNGDIFAGVLVFQDVSSQVRSRKLIASHRDILARVAEGEPLAQTLELIARSIERLLEGRPKAAIMLRSADGRRLELGAAPHFPAAYNESVAVVPIAEGEGSCGTAAYRGAPVIASDIAVDPLWDDYRDVALAHGLAACWSTPIDATDGELVGTFAIYYGESRAPSEHDRALVDLMTETAAVAIERDRVTRAREQQLSDMQQSLLPRSLALVPGVEVEARFHPGTRGLEVGGDFYDLFEVDDRTWGFVVGDVCGHGAEAAAATALARHTTRAVALREADPGRVLAAVHDALKRSDVDRFLTAIYGRLTPTEDGVVLTFANGGHPPPLVLRADASLERPEDHGPLMGVLGAAREYPTVSVRLAPGDSLVLHTDGLTERNPRLPSDEQLQERLAELAGLPAAEAVARLEKSSIGPTSAASDDIALLMMRVTPPAPAVVHDDRDPREAAVVV